MATTPLSLMCIFAHPDDESLGIGSTVAKYAAEGVAVHLLTATRGERGWPGAVGANPGLEALGTIRTAELEAAAHALGIRSINFLGYVDGDLDQADPVAAISRIVTHVRRLRPQVVVTFAPDGAYGHPDHIAISQFTGAALVCAADEQYIDTERQPAHRVTKLYYMVFTKAETTIYTSLVDDPAMTVDGVERHQQSWEDWLVTTRVDGTAYWRTVAQAIACHQSQIAGYPDFASLSIAQQEALWGVRSYYRAWSTVNGGRLVEHDLFAGLR
jgi:LmbE family N-acetylglucosaminyl deacetylase